MTTRLCLTVLLLALAACSGGGDDEPGGIAAAFDFGQGQQGWVAGFADYPDGQEGFYELTADYRALPPELAARGSALFISGNNHSDDLFMFYKRRVTGLVPGRSYRVGFEVEIATSAQSDCVGIGGAPGEGVTLKAGVSAIEPLAVDDGTGTLRMNVDKGNQVTGGTAALALGHIANGQPCGSAQSFVLKTLAGESLDVTADASGAVWLLAGTDSGFEGTTGLYYTRFIARFS